MGGTTILQSSQKLLNSRHRCNILPFYALSWILTWFSHDLEDYRKVIRLIDLFIASQPSMPLYVACAVSLICLQAFSI